MNKEYICLKINIAQLIFHIGESKGSWVLNLGFGVLFELKVDFLQAIEIVHMSYSMKRKLHGKCHQSLVWLNDTPPQKIKWRAISVPPKPMVVALPGLFDTIHLRSLPVNDTSLSHNGSLPILISWRRFSSYKVKLELHRSYFLKWCDAPDYYQKHKFAALIYRRNHFYPTYYGYNCHYYLLRFSGLSYYFVKYFDKINNFKYHPVNEDTYFRPCPRHAHSPKLFSWNDVHEFCKTVFGGTLPQLLSKKEEKEFIHMIQDTEMLFPMKAVYIGLFLSNKGEVKSFFCRSIILYFVSQLSFP